MKKLLFLLLIVSAQAKGQIDSIPNANLLQMESVISNQYVTLDGLHKPTSQILQHQYSQPNPSDLLYKVFIYDSIAYKITDHINYFANGTIEIQGDTAKLIKFTLDALFKDSPKYFTK